MVKPGTQHALTGSGAELVIGGVEDFGALSACVASFAPDVIFHLAAETGTGQSYDEPTRYNLANVVGTTNLIEAIRKCKQPPKRVVLSSSRSIYGEGAGRQDDGTVSNAMPRNPLDLKRGDFGIKNRKGLPVTPVPTPAWLPPMPASIYASTKLMQEYLLQQGLAGTPVELAILRLQNVYGPGQSLSNPYTGVISIFSQLVAKGNKLNIFEDGNIVRDFVYVDDVVRAFVAAGSVDDVPKTPTNIGSGIETSVRHMAMEVLRLLGRDPADHYISGDFRIGDVRYAVADIAGTRKALHWTPTTSFADGLQRFVEWSKA